MKLIRSKVRFFTEAPGPTLVLFNFFGGVTFHNVRADNLKLQLKNIFISWYWTLFINWYWHEEKLTKFWKSVLCTSTAWGVSEHSNTTPFPDPVTPFSEFLTHKAPSHEVAPSPLQILCTYAWSGPQGSVPRSPGFNMPLWALCSASLILMFIRSWRRNIVNIGDNLARSENPHLRTICKHSIVAFDKQRWTSACGVYFTSGYFYHTPRHPAVSVAIKEHLPMRPILFATENSPLQSEYRHSYRHQLASLGSHRPSPRISQHSLWPLHRPWGPGA